MEVDDLAGDDPGSWELKFQPEVDDVRVGA